MRTILGWGSAGLLVLTIGTQIVRQWRAKSSKGVSPWLYVGQSLASAGLLAYSLLGGDRVFAALNSIMILAALVGGALWWRFRERD